MMLKLLSLLFGDPQEQQAKAEHVMREWQFGLRLKEQAEQVRQENDDNASRRHCRIARLRLKARPGTLVVLQ